MHLTIDPNAARSTPIARSFFLFNLKKKQYLRMTLMQIKRQ